MEKPLCPITQEEMADPVVAADGHSYEREAIEEWLKKHDTSPVTNLKLRNKTLIPNHALRSCFGGDKKGDVKEAVKKLEEKNQTETEELCLQKLQFEMLQLKHFHDIMCLQAEVAALRKRTREPEVIDLTKRSRKKSS